MLARIESVNNDDHVIRRQASETQLDALSHSSEKRRRCEDSDESPNAKRVKDDNEAGSTETKRLVNLTDSSAEVNETDEEDDGDESGEFWSGEDEAESDWDGESVNEDDEESEFII